MVEIEVFDDLILILQPAAKMDSAHKLIFYAVLLDHRIDCVMRASFLALIAVRPCVSSPLCSLTITIDRDLQKRCSHCGFFPSPSPPPRCQTRTE